MTKIIHASDWHGQLMQLEWADFYIFTGDMLPNFPCRKKNKPRSGFYSDYDINPSIEIKEQADWIRHLHKQGGYRKLLGNPEAPIVVVRGNHDFVDLAGCFGGEVFEVNLNANRTVNCFDLKIGGFRGVPPIDGRWSDELPQIQRLGKVSTLADDLDIVVCHPPPTGILSSVWGCSELRWRVDQWARKEVKPKLFCFGHVHEKGGEVKEVDGMLFSNAACQYNIINL